MDKKDKSIVIGSSNSNNQIKFIKPTFSEQVDFYVNNLNRLIDQDTYWFCERIGALQAGNLERVESIEKTYLEPLQRKIKELAERMTRL